MSAQIVLNFTTNLNRAVEIVPLNGAYFVGDAKSHKFIIEAKRGNAHESLDGMTITAYFERAGGATVLLTGEVDGEGRAVVTLNDSCYAKKGRFQIAIRATKGEEKVTIFCGYGGMYVTESDTVVTDEKVVASIEDLLKRVEEIEQATQEAKAAAARAEEAAERAESAGGTGGGSGTDERLPQVSEADNGKALVVVDGEWAASEVVGEPGKPGEPGKDGIGIASVEQTTTSTEDGGSNVITVTKTDGSKSTFTVQNGTQGSNGNDGQRGAAILRITTSPSSYTTAIDGFTPSYRVSLSTVKSQARVGSVYIGDTILQSYYTYPVGRVDSSYVYLGGRTSIRGAQGEAGNNGNGILSVEQTTVSTEDGGVNIFTVTETDGTTSEFAVRNGSKGTPGTNGTNGYTPVKGTDYYTPADQESIVQQVIAALGTPIFGTVDENNNIILTGELADGAYTFKYEDAEGNVIDIGTLNQSHGPSYTNQIPIAIDFSGNVVTNGALYTDERWNSSGGQSAATGYFVTGLIPAKVGDMVRIRWSGGGDAGTLQVKGFNADKSEHAGYMSFSNASNASDAVGSIITKTNGYQYNLANGVFDFTMAECNKISTSVRYITVTLYGAPADCIVTVNEAID